MTAEIGFNLQAIREQRADYMESINAIEAVAESENRKCTEEEMNECGTYLEKYTELEKAEKLAEKIDVEKKRLQAAKASATAKKFLPAVQTREHGGPVKKHYKHTVRKGFLQAYDDQDKAYAAGQWWKAALLLDRDAIAFCEKEGDDFGGLQFEDPSAQQVSDVPGKGGFFVPTIVHEAVLGVRDRHGIIMGSLDFGGAGGLLQQYPLSGSDNYNFPKTDDILTIYSGAQFSEISTSDVDYTEVQLRVLDKFTLTPISNTLLRQKPDFAGDQIAQAIGKTFARQSDIEGLHGDGVAGTPYYGITGLTIALGLTGRIPASANTWATLGDDDVSALLQALPDKFFIDGEVSWVCSRSFFYSVFRPLIAARGGSKSDMEGSTGLMFEGFPVRVSDHMPTSYSVGQIALMFGNFRKAGVVGDRQNLTIASDQSTYFTRDSIAVRGKQSYDIQIHEADTTGDNDGTGTGIGAYVGLVDVV